FERKFVKGIFFSQAMDFVHELHPRLSELFMSVGNTMWSSYPWSTKAEACLVSYRCPEMEEWYKKAYPERSDRVLIPLQNSDYMDEYYIAPKPVAERDIDVLVVSSMYEFMNLPVVAEAIKIYREKYSKRIRMTLITGKDFEKGFEKITPQEAYELEKIEAAVKRPKDYIDFAPKVPYFSIAAYYSRAKVVVLGSLVEGKNRAIQEAMSCDTPVVTFQAFNQFIRGNDPSFPEGAGWTAEDFYPESLTDAIHFVLKNQADFHPRREYLKTNGKKNFFNTCLNSFKDYYGPLIPDFQEGNVLQNLWLDLAIQKNYQLSLMDFVYDKNFFLSHAQGLEAIQKTVDFYLSRLDYF